MSVLFLAVLMLMVTLVLLKSLIDDVAYRPIDAYNPPMSSERGSP